MPFFFSDFTITRQSCQGKVFPGNVEKMRLAAEISDIELALDEFNHARYRNPFELNSYVKGRIGSRDKKYYVFIDERCYIQSALSIDDPEKKEQEIASLKRIPDSFRKIVVVKDFIKPWLDENGIQYIGIEQFLLDEDFLSR